MDIEIFNSYKQKFEFGKVETVHVNLDYEGTSFGIDPGIRNMGFAYIYNNQGRLYQLQLDYPKDISKLGRMVIVWKCVSRFMGVFRPDTKVVVEDASYGNHFHQVKLAEMRAAAIMFWYRYQIEPLVLVPMKIRKNVFGSGKIKSFDMGLPSDAEAALICALYAEEKQNV